MCDIQLYVHRKEDTATGGIWKVTIIPHLEVDKYPLPKVKNLFSNISGSIIWYKNRFITHVYTIKNGQFKRNFNLSKNWGLNIYI